MTRPGHPLEVLELADLPEPEAGPGELLVEVVASPISPMDRLAIRGLYPVSPTAGIPGAQGVARVIAQGSGVAAPELGALVLLPVRIGAWRERLSVAADEVTILPEAKAEADGDPARFSTLRVEGLSALVLLEPLAAGDWFVHSPGAGAVGRYFTAIARARGLHSIALVGSRDPIADLWGLGADHVLVREAGLPQRLAELGLPAPRVGFDGSGGLATELLASCLNSGADLVVYGAASRMPLQISVGQVVFRDLRIRGFWLNHWAEAVGRERVQAGLHALLDLGVGEPIVGRFELDDWREAMTRAEQPNLRGRVVLEP